MTLITYPSRVHFADGVLEEALRSELDAHGYGAPLILGEEGDTDTELSQRVYAGLPRRARPRHVPIMSRDTKYDTARTVTELTRGKRPDVILAYGSGRAIAYARKCRQMIHQADAEAGHNTAPKDIFAIPGVDGLPNPCRSSFASGPAMVDVASRTGLPRIVICDPTVTDGSSVEEAAAAAVDALARSLEAYVSDAYNPPADGMAIDGFARAVRATKSAALADDPVYRRELMAAHLNATLAQQKGIGPTQLLSDALRAPHGDRLSGGALSRIILPAVLNTRQIPEDRSDALRRLLESETTKSLNSDIEALFAYLPLPGRLSDLGLTHADITQASRDVQDAIGDGAGAQSGAQTIMEAVF